MLPVKMRIGRAYFSGLIYARLAFISLGFTPFRYTG